MPRELEPLLTPRQVAEILQASVRTVRDLGTDGVLERIEINPRVLRYTRSSVEALMRADGSAER